MIGFFIADMVASSISYTFETLNTSNLWALKGNTFPKMHPNWKMFDNGGDALTEIIKINLPIDFVE